MVEEKAAELAKGVTPTEVRAMLAPEGAPSERERELHEITPYPRRHVV